MERYAWKAKIIPGKKDEYIRRHENIWQELSDVLTEAGIQNYSIWMTNDELFGYYECKKGVAHATKTQSESPVVAKWNEYMKDVMIMEADPKTGAQPQLTQVFSFA